MVRSYQAQAIILRSKAVRDADRLLVLFTREHGKVKAMAYGVAKTVSRKRGALQPFTVTRVLLEKGAELDVARQAEEVTCFPALHHDLSLLSSASYAAELVDLISPENQPNPGIYDLLLQYLGLLGQSETEMLRLAFTVKLMALAGFRPVLDACVQCGAPAPVAPRFSAQLGGLLCEGCRAADPHARTCHSGVLRTWDTLCDWPLQRLGSIRVTGPMRDELSGLIQGYLCYVLEREPRSLSFLLLLGE